MQTSTPTVPPQNISHNFLFMSKPIRAFSDIKHYIQLISFHAEFVNEKSDFFFFVDTFNSFGFSLQILLYSKLLIWYFFLLFKKILFYLKKTDFITFLLMQDTDRYPQRKSSFWRVIKPASMTSRLFNLFYFDQIHYWNSQLQQIFIFGFLKIFVHHSS